MLAMDALGGNRIGMERTFPVIPNPTAEPVAASIDYRLESTKD